MTERPVLVIGAGIVGLSTAWALHKRGVPVQVVDRSVLGDSASCGNAGLLSFDHPPLTQPGVSWRGLRWMFDSTSPLYIRVQADPQLLCWLWTFHRHCTHAHLERCMPTLSALSRLTAPLWDELQAGVDCDFRRDGWDDVCLTEAGLDDAQHEAEVIGRYGLTWERIDGDTLRADAPAWRPEVLGAVRWQDSASLDPRALLLGLAEQLVAAGVPIRTGVEVQALRLERDRVTGATTTEGPLDADQVVLCAGLWSDGLAASAGLAVPMQPARGYHRDLNGIALPVRASILHETFMAATPFHGRLRLAGTLEIQGRDKPWIPERLEQLSRGAAPYLHRIETADTVEDWAGYRPCTADGMPVIGEVARRPGLYVGTGHAMLGMTLGPATGELLARAICGEPMAFDLSMVRPDRFSRHGRW